MKTLEEVFEKYVNTDKNTHHSYGSWYAELFAPYRDKPIELWEVGVREGDSLRAWSEYFHHVNSVFLGVDNGSEKGLPTFTDEESDRIHLLVADTTKPREFLLALDGHLDCFSNFDGPQELADIIIDDGCHHPYAQVATFALLSPFLKPGGVYVVEDIEDISFAQTMQRLFGGEVIDRREIKQRHDDILLVYRKPK